MGFLVLVSVMWFLFVYFKIFYICMFIWLSFIKFVSLSNFLMGSISYWKQIRWHTTKEKDHQYLKSAKQTLLLTCKIPTKDLPLNLAQSLGEETGFKGPFKQGHNMGNRTLWEGGCSRDRSHNRESQLSLFHQMTMFNWWDLKHANSWIKQDEQIWQNIDAPSADSSLPWGAL